MSEMHSIGWYASRVAPHLPKEAFKPVPQRLWGGLAYLAVTVSGIAAIGLMDLNPWVNLVVAVVLGQAFAGLGFLGHEILHGTVVKTAWLRDLLGCIAFAQFSLGAKIWRKWHNMEHHAHTQDEELDPDAWASMEEFYQRPFMKWIYKLPPWFRSLFNFASFTVFFSIHSLLMFRRYVGDLKPSDRAAAWVQLIIPWTFWFGMLAWMGPAKWVFAYVIPLMIANFLVISYISTNHQLNPLTDVNDPLANSLTVTVPKWVDVLHFNFSYHTEHHLFPGMNPRYGPAVKAAVKELWPDRYHEMPMTQAMKALWMTPRIYYQHNDLVDPLRGDAFGSLGNGLNPSQIKAHKKVDINAAVAAPAMRLEGLKQNPAQGD